MSKDTPNSNKDQETLLGIAFADQALISSHIAMFAARTGNPHETIDLLHEIVDEISDRYQLTGTAKETMKLRINKTISMASAIVGNRAEYQAKKDTH